MEPGFSVQSASYSGAVRRRGVLRALALAATLVVGAPAHALVITPNFGSTITGDANAVSIESAINSAIGTLQGLYSDPVNLTVDFSYSAAGSGTLLSTSQSAYAYSYGDYTSALAADAAANPGNTTLATAVANLGSGNDANGNNAMVVTYGQGLLLSQYGLTAPVFAANASININSLQSFDFTQPTSASSYDLIGGLQHELDEVLGGGGAGSTLNAILQDPGTFSNLYGSLDLYRYSAAGTPSFTTSSTATSYFSIDGGVTSIAGFNQSSSGDFADFAPPCGTGGGSGELIQNAFNCKGPDEAYTTASPEFAMLQSIGWNTAQAVPDPATIALLGLGLAGLGFSRRGKQMAG